MYSDVHGISSSAFAPRSTLEIGISLGIHTACSLKAVQTQNTKGLMALSAYEFLPASAQLQQCTAPILLLAQDTLGYSSSLCFGFILFHQVRAP